MGRFYFWDNFLEFIFFLTRLARINVNALKGVSKLVLNKKRRAANYLYEIYYWAELKYVAAKHELPAVSDVRCFRVEKKTINMMEPKICTAKTMSI